MSRLSVYSAPDKAPRVIENFDEITAELEAIGVQFERWQADRPLSDDAGQEEVIEAYRDSIDKLNKQYSFQSLDVVSLKPDNPKKTEFRQKFLSEHTHDDFEVRFFVDGKGVFYLHVDGKVYAVLCEKGDLISVPAGVTHWFDMGTNPDFKCIRFFTIPDGWVGNFTGSPIAKQYPDYDQLTVSA
ncbi:MAG TPA: cupin domain-containing protein [Gammaproteobacteria bacterium]